MPNIHKPFRDANGQISLGPARARPALAPFSPFLPRLFDRSAGTLNHDMQCNILLCLVAQIITTTWKKKRGKGPRQKCGFIFRESSGQDRRDDAPKTGKAYRVPRYFSRMILGAEGPIRRRVAKLCILASSGAKRRLSHRMLRSSLAQQTQTRSSNTRSLTHLFSIPTTLRLITKTRWHEFCLTHARTGYKHNSCCSTTSTSAPSFVSLHCLS